MTFNSLQFALFFILVYLIYLVLHHKAQNILLLAASCVFYAAWDWRFLSLLFISTTTDYFCGLKIHENKDERLKKKFLFVSIIVNLSILIILKYCNFFVTNIVTLLNYAGVRLDLLILKTALPLGISFYTFRTMTYTIDIYAGKMKPTSSYTDYALFVTFFPLLAAGPIMRARDLMPQIESPRKPDLANFYEGSYLIFWGLFQKIFVADNLALIANEVFNSPPPYNGAIILSGIYAFAFQLYCDFAGYSNIARGLGKCMGFDITINFNLPYFATNPQSFWNRWHISLSTWFRDYLYYPIALSKRHWGTWSSVFATIITFTLCGLWHGAAWTFVIWGIYWAILLVIYILIKPSSRKATAERKAQSVSIWHWIKIALFFQLICIGWLFFRAESCSQAIQMLHGLFLNFKIINNPYLIAYGFRITFYVIILLLMEIFQFFKNDQMAVYRSNIFAKAALYIICYYLMILHGAGNGKDFIYFQF